MFVGLIGYLYVSGSTGVQGAGFPNTINAGSTGLNGFKAFYDETYNYSGNAYGYFNSSSSPSNQLTLSNMVGIQLDAKTYISLFLGTKRVNQSLTSTVYIPDTSAKLNAMPTALTKAQRNKFLVDSSALYKYVSIKEKQ